MIPSVKIYDTKETTPVSTITLSKKEIVVMPDALSSTNLISKKDLQENEFKQLLENPAFRALHFTNVFTSHEQKNTVHRMAELADLMYGMDNLEEVSKLFPKGLIPFPAPAEFGVKIPSGLHVQAFRHGNEILFAIRGTNL